MELDIGAPVVMVRPLAGAPDDSENECYESD